MEGDRTAGVSCQGCGHDVIISTERFPARAETLSSEEKARVWPHLVELFPPYAEYQAKTDRDIPVVRLRRTA